MSEFKYFDRGQVLIGGGPIADLEDGRISISNGFQDVITMGPGYAGGSKGPVMGTITAKRAVPRAGFNKAQDLHDAVLKQTPISAMAIVGGKKYVVTGVPKGLDRGFAVTATAMEDFSVTGGVEVTNL